MADFLIALKKSSADIHCHVTPFSICEYIRALLPRIREKNPPLLDDLLPIWQELDEFSRAETTLPIDFCHGDFHPNNVLWGDRQLNGVIDWEFSGHKVAGYDVATLLGCLGMDNPEFLTADMTFAFLNKLKANDFHSDIVWHWLPDYIAATRFACVGPTPFPHPCETRGGDVIGQPMPDDVGMEVVTTASRRCSDGVSPSGGVATASRRRVAKTASHLRLGDDQIKKLMTIP